MINYNKNDLINRTLLKYNETFSYTLDTEDFIKPKTKDMINKYITKNLKKHFKKIDKEDRKYQRILNKKIKERERAKKKLNKVEKPKKKCKLLLKLKELYRKIIKLFKKDKSQRTSKKRR